MSFWIQYPDLTFDEKEHRYAWQGRPVPSVTGIPDSLGFRKDDTKPFHPIGCPDFAKKQADADKGNALHKINNAIVTGKKITFNDPEKELEAKLWIDKLYRFLDKHQFTPLYDLSGNMLSEYPMYSEKRKFAGTPDWIVREVAHNVIWLIDWKSSGAYQKSYSWQTAGYEILFREVFGGIIFDKREKIVRCTVMFNTDKDMPKEELRSSSTNPEDTIEFQSNLNTYRLAA